MGLLLGGTVEKNMRTALVISQGDWSYFVTRPISIVLIVMIVLTFLFPVFQELRKKKAKTAEAEA